MSIWSLKTEKSSIIPATADLNKVKQEDTSIVEDIRNDHVQVDESIYVVIDSNVSNWKIVAVLDSSVVYRNTLINTFIFLVIALIFIMLSFYISSTFSKWFTKPIRNMASQMQKSSRET